MKNQVHQKYPLLWKTMQLQQGENYSCPSGESMTHTYPSTEIGDSNPNFYLQVSSYHAWLSHTCLTWTNMDHPSYSKLSLL